MRRLVLVLALLTACEGGGGSTSVGTATSARTPAASTTAPPSAVPATTTATTTTAATTVPADPVACDRARMLATVDRIAGDARLAPGEPWGERTGGGPFDARTNPAEEFRARLALDCSLEATQRATGGAERLLLAAWTGPRYAFMLQATDPPSTPYGTTIRFQLFIEQPYGEWVEDQFVWAATLAGGESIVIGAADFSVAVTAKSWLTAVPRFEDLPVTIESERVAIDTLVAAGARNVSVAEPASVGSAFGSVQLTTPLGLAAIAVVAPADAFDPMVPLLHGETVMTSVDGVDIRSTAGGPEDYDVSDVGFTCSGFGWRITSVYGTVEEMTAFAADLVRAC